MTIYTFIIDTITTLGILFSSFYIFAKAVSYTMSIIKRVFLVMWCVLLTLIFAALSTRMASSIIWLIVLAISIVFIWVLTKFKLDTVISAFLLSFGIGYVLYYVASLIVGIVSMSFLSGEYPYGSALNYDQPMYLLLYSITSTFQLFLSFLLFHIRRFKNGFPFLLKRYAVIVALISAGTVLVFVTWIKIATEMVDAFTIPLVLVGVLIIGIGIFIWIRRGISSFQWRKTMLRNNDLLMQELAAEKDKNKQLMDKLETAQNANHKIIRRLEALEYKVASMSASTEFSGELAVSMEDIQQLQREYHEDVVRGKEKPRLPSVKVKEIDNLFESYAAKLAGNNIDFSLKVTGSIPYMTEHVIPQNKLETMIGDHMQNALIAVNASNNVFRSVLAVIGVVEDYYELTIFDSGIPFEADTLIRLGTERVTTHADAGGSGIGFMTTFETMRDCGASLIIREKKPNSADYTKSVTIRFDGRNEYKIEAYKNLTDAVLV